MPGKIIRLLDQYSLPQKKKGESYVEKQFFQRTDYLPKGLSEPRINEVKLEATDFILNWQNCPLLLSRYKKLQSKGNFHYTEINKFCSLQYLACSTSVGLPAIQQVKCKALVHVIYLPRDNMLH